MTPKTVTDAELLAALQADPFHSQMANIRLDAHQAEVQIKALASGKRPRKKRAVSR